MKNNIFNGTISRCLRIILCMEKIALVIWMLGPVLFFLFNVLHPTTFMGNVRGEYQKNYEVLLFLTLIMFGMLFMAWLLIKVLRKKISVND